MPIGANIKRFRLIGSKFRLIGSKSLLFQSKFDNFSQKLQYCQTCSKRICSNECNTVELEP